MKNQPIRLLVSVRDSVEASAALEGGADFLDIKDPDRGSMGMADPFQMEAVVQMVNRRCTVSAALGDLRDAPPEWLPSGLDYVKVGVASAGSDWQASLAMRFLDAENAVESSIGGGIVAGYADHQRAVAPPLAELVEWTCQSGAAGLLIDTFVKDGQGLFHWIDEAAMIQVIQRLRASRLLVALAGSLDDTSFPRALALKPHVIAVRGAACMAGDRRQAVDVKRVRALADLVAAHNAAPVVHGS